MSKTEWTEEWPTEPGYYWFYGWCWRSEIRDGKAPRFFYVRVRPCSNSMMYVTDGHFMYEEEGGYGLWSKAQLPELPEITRPATT
jgi:hypothetical protein